MWESWIEHGEKFYEAVTELQGRTREELVEMLPMAYKNTRGVFLTVDLLQDRLNRMEAIVGETASLPSVDQPAPNLPGE